MTLNTQVSALRFNRVLVVCVAAQVLVLAVVEGVVGLSRAGWATGVVYAFVAGLLLTRAMATRSQARLGPADWVTLTRMVLVGAVTALVWQYPTPAIPVLAVLALSLDWVDGQVARRTHTCSELGARFDMEVDAFLIFVLSVAVAGQIGGWVLLLGLARYLFVAAAWVWPWMAARLPYRYWRKVVAAVQGIGLWMVTTGMLPLALSRAVMLVAAALLAESFGRDVIWLWRRRGAFAATSVNGLAQRAST